MVVVVVLFVAIVSAGGYASFYDKLMKHDKVKTNKAIGFFKKSKVSEDNLNSIIQLVHIAAPGKCTANGGGNVVYCVEQRQTKKRVFLSHHYRCLSSKLKSGANVCMFSLSVSISFDSGESSPVLRGHAFDSVFHERYPHAPSSAQQTGVVVEVGGRSRNPEKEEEKKESRYVCKLSELFNVFLFLSIAGIDALHV